MKYLGLVGADPRFLTAATYVFAALGPPPLHWARTKAEISEYLEARVPNKGVPFTDRDGRYDLSSAALDGALDHLWGWLKIPLKQEVQKESLADENKDEKNKYLCTLNPALDDDLLAYFRRHRIEKRPYFRRCLYVCKKLRISRSWTREEIRRHLGDKLDDHDAHMWKSDDNQAGFEASHCRHGLAILRGWTQGTQGEKPKNHPSKPKTDSRLNAPPSVMPLALQQDFLAYLTGRDLEPGFCECADLMLHAVGGFHSSMSVGDVVTRLEDERHAHDNVADNDLTPQLCAWKTTPNALKAALRHLRQFLTIE
jgi:hypothetical protein